MRQSAALLLAVALIAASGCSDTGVEYPPLAILEGQVYLVSKPGPIPTGWIPPPLETVNTIQVLSSDKALVTQVSTDTKGKFSVSLKPATYFLRVRESPAPAETGPYTPLAGQRITAEAHFDNGMR